ncbi:YaaL family protein [Isobaculum melis]|uniref:DUF2508 domain-containing protein n=1 Tax=Isobaculum melis TaxID=142588 RepID=A0A1H9SNB4_9LACT|nr:YaaL family protein [Isobaculum melis]SER86520.1 Protein of unknown function [Isobaculum melis]
MFGRKKAGQLRSEYDQELLALIQRTKVQWDHLKNIELNVFDQDRELMAQAKLEEAKYFYLFKEARARKIKA